jgi:hypothetical protein
VREGARAGKEGKGSKAGVLGIGSVRQRVDAKKINL